MASGQKPRVVSLPFFFLTIVTSCVFRDLSVCLLGPKIHQPELKTTRDGFPDVCIEFSEHLDHDLVFSTRCALPESKRNLPDLLTIDPRKGMQDFTRPSQFSACDGCVKSSLKCPCIMSVRHFRCSSFSALRFYRPFPRPELWFAVVDLSNVMALPIVSLLCTEVSLVSVSSFVVLCAVRWRESSVSQSLFPVCVPDTVCALRSR